MAFLNAATAFVRCASTLALHDSVRAGEPTKAGAEAALAWADAPAATTAVAINAHSAPPMQIWDKPLLASMFSHDGREA
ncbi:MAG: hypothetical protein ABR583_02920 [Gaiellaceae bacterium]